MNFITKFSSRQYILGVEGGGRITGLVAYYMTV